MSQRTRTILGIIMTIITGMTTIIRMITGTTMIIRTIMDMATSTDGHDN